MWFWLPSFTTRERTRRISAKHKGYASWDWMLSLRRKQRTLFSCSSRMLGKQKSKGAWFFYLKLGFLLVCIFFFSAALATFKTVSHQTNATLPLVAFSLRFIYNFDCYDNYHFLLISPRPDWGHPAHSPSQVFHSPLNTSCKLTMKLPRFHSEPFCLESQ